MGILDSVLKVFVGDKTQKDLKQIYPIVDQIKSFESALEKIDLEQLRQKTIDFKAKIHEANKEEIAKITLEKSPFPERNYGKTLFAPIVPKRLAEALERKLFLGKQLEAGRRYTEDSRPKLATKSQRHDISHKTRYQKIKLNITSTKQILFLAQHFLSTPPFCIIYARHS